jgi:putative FmdB family regulatory protein
VPNYGYRCQTCQREFEMLQRMSDPPGAACPECGGAGTRLFYPTGILFKGSGFYKTDSRSAPAATPVAGADGAKSGADSGGGDAAKPAPATKDAPAPSTPSTTSATPPAAKPAAST